MGVCCWVGSDEVVMNVCRRLDERVCGSPWSSGWSGYGAAVAAGEGGVDVDVDVDVGAVCVGRGMRILDAAVSKPDTLQLRLAQRCPMPLLKTGGVETERVGTGQVVMKQLGAAVECTP